MAAGELHIHQKFAFVANRNFKESAVGSSALTVAPPEVQFTKQAQTHSIAKNTNNDESGDDDCHPKSSSSSISTLPSLSDASRILSLAKEATAAPKSLDGGIECARIPFTTETTLTSEKSSCGCVTSPVVSELQNVSPDGSSDSGQNYSSDSSHFYWGGDPLSSQSKCTAFCDEASDLYRPSDVSIGSGGRFSNSSGYRQSVSSMSSSCESATSAKTSTGALSLATTTIVTNTKCSSHCLASDDSSAPPRKHFSPFQSPRQDNHNRDA